MGRLPFHFDDLPDRDPGRPARRERARADARRSSTGPADALTVSQLTDLIKGLLIERMPRPIRVIGEVSNFRQRNGHWYLSLKDEHHVIDCVVWASTAKKIAYQPEQGRQVLATGRCDFYGPQGKLQLYLDQLDPIGQGALEIRLRQLMAQLRQAGYFAEDRKKPLPAYPQRIAVITSRSGAALSDVIRTAQQRWAGCRLFLLDVRVQGAEAADEIARAIGWLSRHHRRLGIDAAILTRGGGSLEDLWCFNDPVVAEAIYHATMPIVAAIGHETDTTIAELVADLRCSTPTQAAARLVPDARAEHRHLDQVADTLAGALKRHALLSRNHLASLARHELFRRPARLAEPARQRLAESIRRLDTAVRRVAGQQRQRLARHETAMATMALDGRLRVSRQALVRLAEQLHTARAHRLALAHSRLSAAAGHLESVGPRGVLRRGFSYTTDPTGRLIRSVRQVRPGQSMQTHLADGCVESQVTGASPADPSAPTAPGPSRRPASGRPPGPATPADPPGGLFDPAP